MYITGFASIPHLTVTVGCFKKVQEAAEGCCKTRGEADSLIYQTPFNIDLVSSVSFTIKVTLSREPLILNTHM